MVTVGEFVEFAYKKFIKEIKENKGVGLGVYSHYASCNYNSIAGTKNEIASHIRMVTKNLAEHPNHPEFCTRSAMLGQLKILFNFINEGKDGNN